MTADDDLALADKYADDLIELRAENQKLRDWIEDACMVFDHYGLPEHALHYRRKLNPPTTNSSDAA